MHAKHTDLYIFITTCGKHYKPVFHVLTPHNQISMTLGGSVMLGRAIEFTWVMRKNSVKVFLHRFVLCLIMIFQVKGLIVIKLSLMSTQKDVCILAQGTSTGQ